MEFKSNFEYDLAFGQEGEMSFADLTNKKIEVKRDRLAHKTGNIFIEYESRGKPSGIATSKADFYAYYISDICILITLDKLKSICREYLNTSKDIVGGDDNTSKGILLPIIELFKRPQGKYVYPLAARLDSVSEISEPLLSRR